MKMREIAVTKKEEVLVMKAVALCFKPYLKPEEAMIYCNLEHTQFAKRTAAAGIYKNEGGYYEREALNLMMSGSVKRVTGTVSKRER
jgi:hypothetical protein